MPHNRKTNSPGESRTRPWQPGTRRLEALIAEALVDAYGDSEQRTAFLTMLEEHLALPFDTEVLGASCRS